MKTSKKKIWTGICAAILLFSNSNPLVVSGETDEKQAFGIQNDKVNQLYNGWKLKYEENFENELFIDDQPWIHDDYSENNQWYVEGELDDNGEFFHKKGGKDFARHLDSFWLMRKSVPFGDSNWLTVELADRDYSKTGELENPVSFSTVNLPNGKKAGKLTEPHYGGGGLIRSTDPLPAEYRIEYRLKTIDFGGMRNGTFEYDGKTNGIIPDETKTNFPWKAGGNFEGPSEPNNSNFDSIENENGFYFLTIVDYHDPAPHNNVFIHTHRKVGMDAYNVNGLWSDQYEIVDPSTGELYGYNSKKSTRNAINALFMNGDKFKDHDMPYNDFLIETEAGSFEGDIVSIAEIQPELMPEEDYLFAIERNKNSYTMEVTGNFLHAGLGTLRYTREFEEDDKPIFHYNNRPNQYDGKYNHTWDDGDFQIEDTWPAESAYPDYFIIGDPHITHYEGSATISDIKLYVPENVDVDYLQTVVWQLYESKKIGKEQMTLFTTKLEDLQNIDDFVRFLEHQKEHENIDDEVYQKLTEDISLG
ncbi:hypothetical protein [Dolosigranulum savutiense]|uniref:Uncharacterized protein n=1 Tax=Dolosigranulum savutiense TaxID=3110288 RepID=A0AB74TH05_9LACT